MARKKAIMQSVAAAKEVPKLDRPLLPTKTSDADINVEVVAKHMYAGQWDSNARDMLLKEMGCSLSTMAKY